MFLTLTATLMTTTGCAFMQPSSSRAPAADLVGSGVFLGVETVAVAAQAESPNPQRYNATIIATGVIVAVYACSAMYGYTRDPQTQNSDDPILGLQLLAVGLAGVGRGMAGHSNQDDRGCCSYHGGLVGEGVCNTYTNHLQCNDGTSSPTCRCE